MERKRAQAIIIQNNRVLFGEGLVDGERRHFFIGGGIVEGETPEEAVIREIKEESNVDGNIIFIIGEECENHFTFLVDIGHQKPTLGCDPEESQVKLQVSERNLQGLKFISLDNIKEFTSIDIKYFKMLIKECNAKGYFSDWYKLMVNLTDSFS